MMPRLTIYLSFLLGLAAVSTASYIPDHMAVRSADHPIPIRGEDLKHFTPPTGTLNPKVEALLHGTSTKRSVPAERDAEALLEADEVLKERNAALVKRTEPVWTDVIGYQQGYLGFIGQNIALVTNPGFRAICPDGIAALETCTQDFTDPCLEPRVEIEWCFLNQMMYCSTEWWDISVICFLSTLEDCADTLHAMWQCTNVYAPPLPPIPSGWGA